MTSGKRRAATAVMAVAAGLLLGAGCGPAESTAVSEVAERARAATAARSSPLLEAAKIEWYWTFGRFLWDNHQVVPRSPAYEHWRVAKAQSDAELKGEWDRVSNPEPPATPIRPFTYSDSTIRSDSYVWGLTRSGANLFFGTVSNMLCFSLENDFLWGFPGLRPQISIPNAWECNFAPGLFNDWRPPHLYAYDLVEAFQYSLDPPAGSPEDMLRMQTAGFRSAGAARAKDGTPVVFLAGPSDLPSGKGIIVFAFNGQTRALIGATRFNLYDNVRTWAAIADEAVVDGETQYRDQLYMGVSVADVNQANRGAVLRWKGGTSNDQEATDWVFDFEVVGVLESEAGNIAIHEDEKTHEKRVYVATWPVWVYGGNQDPTNWKGTSLYRSPVIGVGGLTSAAAADWTRLWSITQYEHDFAASVTSAGGVIESYGGYVYWGTMHVPFAATGVALMNSDLWAALNGGGSVTIDDAVVQRAVNWMLGSHRNPALFRGRDVTVETKKGPVTKFQVELVYGEKYLPKAVLPPKGDGVYRIDASATYATGYTPLYGASGFGNFFNAYNWSSAKYDGKLWVGTFDWVQLIGGVVEAVVPLPKPPDTPLAELFYRAALDFFERTGNWVPRSGADLYRFDCVDCPAVAEDLTGLGNQANYGFRTMTTDEWSLFVGTANALNRHPDGGWELIQLTYPSPP